MTHPHYCSFADHYWQHDVHLDGRWCTEQARAWVVKESRLQCSDCQKRWEKYAQVVIPAKCCRCGVWKRAPDGRALYVTGGWMKHRRIVCPTCQETENLMDLMQHMVDDSEDEVPF